MISLASEILVSEPNISSFGYLSFLLIFGHSCISVSDIRFIFVSLIIYYLLFLYFCIKLGLLWYSILKIWSLLKQILCIHFFIAVLVFDMHRLIIDVCIINVTSNYSFSIILYTFGCFFISLRLLYSFFIGFLFGAVTMSFVS